MRYAVFLVLLSLVAGPCLADTLIDAFGPNVGSDVVGDRLFFDIKSADMQMSGNQAVVTLLLNYGGAGQHTLASYHDLVFWLNPGDLLFYDPSDPNLPLSMARYAVPLVSHDQMVIGDNNQMYQDKLKAGSLYAVGGDIVVRNSSALFASQGQSTAGYEIRPDALILANYIGGGTPSALTSGGTTLVNPYGDGSTNPFLEVTAQFTASAGFMKMITDNNNKLGFSFASATCGNDVISGVFSLPAGDTSPTPEPPASLLLAAGAGVIGLVRAFRGKR